MTYSANSCLQAQQLSCERAERLLFHGLSFDLEPGQALFIRGPNGSGKSSLLRMLVGLLAICEGEIAWCGTATEACRAAYHQQLLYLGHRSVVNGSLTVRENVEFIAALAGVSHVSIDSALQAVELEAFADEQAGRLSAGQQRRIALQRLVLQKAQLWVLDEPSTALDKSGQQWLFALCQRHLAANGMLVVVSHQEFALDTSITQQLQLTGNGAFHFD